MIEIYITKITVYTTPACVQCTATKRALDNAARDFCVELGYQQAPVVVADSAHWSGFRPERIKDLAAGTAAAA